MTTITFSLERDVGISISTTFVRITSAPQLRTSILTYLGLRIETTVYLDCTAQWVLEHWTGADIYLTLPCLFLQVRLCVYRERLGSDIWLPAPLITDLNSIIPAAICVYMPLQ